MLVDNYIPVPGSDYAGGMVDAFQGGFSHDLYRPFLDPDGVPRVFVNAGWTVEKGERVPIKKARKVVDVMNKGIINPVLMTANATSLRKEQWIELDRAIIRAVRARLRAWDDLAMANSFGGFDGMSRLTLEYEAMSDPGEALVDFDGLTEGRTDSPQFKLRSLPLPITHSDFWFSERRLMVSRGQTPLDTTMAEAAGRRVAEMVEKTTIGVETGAAYGTVSSGPTAHDGTSTVYGYTNFPDRVTKTDLTTPLGTNPDATVQDVLEMRSSLYDQNYFGPYVLYHSTDWDQFLDDDYVTGTSAQGLAAPSRTLRQRLQEIENISAVRRLDFLPASTNPFTLILVQMTSDVARAVIGMNLRTVQWPSVGGMRINFKVMAIWVPQLRSDFSGSTGILHATTS